MSEASTDAPMVSTTERRIIAGLAAACLVTVAIGVLTIPSAQNLEDVARNHPSTERRIEALGSLFTRGHWTGPKDARLHELLDGQPDLVRRFALNVHGVPSRLSPSSAVQVSPAGD